MFFFVGLLVLSEIKIHLITIQTFLFLVVFFLNFGSGFKNVFICPNMLTTFNLSEMSSVMQENRVLELLKSSSEDFIMAAFQLRWSRQVIRHRRFTPRNSTSKLCKKKIPLLLPALLQSCVQSLNGSSTQLPKKFWVSGAVDLLLPAIICASCVSASQSAPRCGWEFDAKKRSKPPFWDFGTMSFLL